MPDIRAFSSIWLCETVSVVILLSHIICHYFCYIRKNILGKTLTEVKKKEGILFRHLLSQ